MNSWKMSFPAIGCRQNEAAYSRVFAGFLESKDAICGQINQSQAHLTRLCKLKVAQIFDDAIWMNRG
jgi:hypothetical protein